MADARQIAHQLRISRRMVQRIALEPPVATVDDAAAHAARGIGRPGVGDGITTHRRQFQDRLRGKIESKQRAKRRSNLTLQQQSAV